MNTRRVGGEVLCAGMAVLMAMMCPLEARADTGSAHQVSQPRPIELGTSGGNINDRSTLYCCSGTLGALVQDALGVQYVLSNNHVLARANGAGAGEDVNQPGQIDQNCAQDGVVADLSDFVPITFRKGRSRPANHVDAAIAEVRAGQVRTDGSILDVGTVSADTVGAFVGQAVQKSGRTTGHTTGTVSAIDVTVDIGYSQECGGASNKVARFVNQIRITPGGFSAGGDSGSLILESDSTNPADGLPRAVGLLFAGSSSSTLANPIDTVLGSLSVTMVGGPPVDPGPTGSISGFVTDASDGSAIAGATVSVDTGQSNISGADGSYVVADVPVGGRTITAIAAGYESQSQSANVSEGLDTQIDLALAQALLPAQSIVQCVTYTTEGGKNSGKHLLIAVTVTDDFGAPLASAQVSVSVTRDGAPFGTASATTNGSGEATFTAKNAASGAYETTVTAVVSGSLVFEGSTPSNVFAKGTDPVPATFCRSGSSGETEGNTPAAAGALLRRARAANARHSGNLMAIPGVVGHGVGLSDGDGPVIEVYLPNDNAATRAQIPRSLDGTRVKVVVTGSFEAY